MRPWLRAPATMPGFSRITAMAVTGDGPDRPGTVQVHPAMQARHLQHLAQRARSPFVLVHPAGTTPSPDWLGAALELLEAEPALAAVSAGSESLPTLCLDAGAMLARRTALLGSGGLAPELQGVGDGLDLAWRLWAMGQRVTGLPGESRAELLPPALRPCSVYQAYWSWLQILVRNCEQEVLGQALSAALLRLLAAAGEAADQTAVLCGEGCPAAAPAPPAAGSAIQDVTYLRRDPAAGREPRYRVGRGVGEMLVTVHDVTLSLPRAFDERKQIQALRLVSDAEIEAQLGRPPLEIVQEQMAALSRSALQAEMAAAGGEKTGERNG